MDKLKNVFGIFSKNFFEKFFSAWFLSSAIIITTAVEKIELGNINIPVFIYHIKRHDLGFHRQHGNQQSCHYQYFSHQQTVFHALNSAIPQYFTNIIGGGKIQIKIDYSFFNASAGFVRNILNV